MQTKKEIDARRDEALSLLADVVTSFGAPERPQYIQEMPVRMTVWRAFAENPNAVHKLLIAPNDEIELSTAARGLRQAFEAEDIPATQSQIMTLRNNIRLQASMDQFFKAVLPTTWWFHDMVAKGLDDWVESWTKLSQAKDLDQMRRDFRAAPDKALWRFLAAWSVIRISDEWARKWVETAEDPRPGDREMVHWQSLATACDALIRVTDVDDMADLDKEFQEKFWGQIEPFMTGMKDMVDPFIKRIKRDQKVRKKMGTDLEPPAVWSIDMNRPVELTTEKSRQTVKVDAAERVFEGSAADICWAVIDSGIDATHPAFAKSWDDLIKPLDQIDPHNSRIEATYDFNRLTRLLNNQFDMLLPEVEIAKLEKSLDTKSGREKYGTLDDAVLMTLYHKNASRVPGFLSKKTLSQSIKDADFREDIKGYVKDIKERITEGQAIDWALMEPLIRMPHDPDLYEAPRNYHGTHVGGTLAGNLPAQSLKRPDGKLIPGEPVRGMCPDMTLIDMRVCDARGVGDEFLVLAALQFVDYLNKSQDRIRVHGANLSLSIRHLVSSYGCGQTPVCREANHLVANGVVVVSAAGNKGSLKIKTEQGTVDSYSWSSITDPGNAADVITVGATHRTKPHTYGISYFSSRGPTGDGRQKPDLVAPGEKITAPVPGPDLLSDHGTSMAAPHVSGAAAMMLARYPEFIGQPQKVKDILIATATDLGRRKEFQGAGLVDVLRALQSV